MPAPNITSATVTNVAFPPGSANLNVTVSIHRRINRQARKRNRGHQLAISVTYDSANGTESVSATVLVSETTLIERLPDKRRAVLALVPIGATPPPSGNPNFNATVQLIVAPKAGRERDDDEGDDESITDETYDNT
jgi:hypothetical protein